MFDKEAYCSRLFGLHLKLLNFFFHEYSMRNKKSLPENKLPGPYTIICIDNLGIRQCLILKI